jgi:hypothetical protein
LQRTLALQLFRKIQSAITFCTESKILTRRTIFFIPIGDKKWIAKTEFLAIWQETGVQSVQPVDYSQTIVGEGVRNTS